MFDAQMMYEQTSIRRRRHPTSDMQVIVLRQLSGQSRVIAINILIIGVVVVVVLVGKLEGCHLRPASLAKGSHTGR